MTANRLDAAPRRDRIAVLAGLALLIAASWAYLLRGAGIEMDQMDMGGGQIMLMPPAWTAGYAALVTAHVGGHDDRDDAAGRHARHSASRRRRRAGIGGLVHHRLSHDLDRV
jgi:predicted metal-binding membrane protein